MTDAEEYKRWIASADPRSLIKQLNMEVKQPLVTAQNLVNMLWLMANPSPAIQERIDNGELNQEQMLSQIGELIEQVFATIDFYRDSLNEE
jgi:hypothetical protein